MLGVIWFTHNELNLAEFLNTKTNKKEYVLFQKHDSFLRWLGNKEIGEIENLKYSVVKRNEKFPFNAKLLL
ncbi:MAG: hypothetical protein Wins2KO_04010 [Winogradskyella sp.]